MEYIFLFLTVFAGGLIALWLVPVKYEKYVLSCWATCLITMVAAVAYHPWRMARIVYDMNHFF